MVQQGVLLGLWFLTEEAQGQAFEDVASTQELKGTLRERCIRGLRKGQ